MGLLTLLALCAAGAATGGPACDAARRYARLVQSQRYGQIGPLFSPKGVWFTPVGEVKEGPKAIGAFYERFLGERRPDFRTDHYVDDGRVCVMDVSMKVRVDETGRILFGSDGAAAIISDGSTEAGVFVRRAIDHFTVDAKGRITRMIVYNAPTNYWRP